MRCKCCNEPIKHERINKLTHKQEDLCAKCLAISMQTAYNTNYETQDDDNELILDLIGWDSK